MKLLDYNFDIINDNIEKVEIIKKDYNYYINLFKNEEYFNKLNNINKIISLDNNKPIIFVYSPPKVGSTSLISTFRVFFINDYNILHIHDEEMIKVLFNINININELIYFNKYLNKTIYIFDIYRTPIERKISAFFEKIGSFHFNVCDENVNYLKIEKVIKRFNDIFFNIANEEDYFFEKFNIKNKLPNNFDFNKKYLFIENNNIKYFKLRIKDSNIWSNILSEIFKCDITVIKDYETSNKIYKNLYKKFYENYKIPKNYLEIIKNDKYLNYYYDKNEINEYLNLWNSKIGENYYGFSSTIYKYYENIILENTNFNIIQPSFIHYFDEGCLCKACNFKRNETIEKLKNGIKIEKIIHNETIKEYSNFIANKNLKNIIVSSKIKKENINNKNKKQNSKIIINNINKIINK